MNGSSVKLNEAALIQSPGHQMEQTFVCVCVCAIKRKKKKIGQVCDP